MDKGLYIFDYISTKLFATVERGTKFSEDANRAISATQSEEVGMPELCRNRLVKPYTKCSDESEQRGVSYS
jgi:hypothetical protein